MELNKNGKLARFYKWSYSVYELPENFCNFFWWLLLAIVLFPLTWGTHPLPDDPPMFVRAILGFIFDALLVLLAWGIYHAILDPLQAVKLIGIAVGALIALAALIAAYIYLRSKIFSKKQDSFFNEVSEIVSAKVESVKKDYCPKITWK